MDTTICATDTKTISRLSFGTYMDVGLGLADNVKEELFDEIVKRFSAKPVIKYNCHNCGGVLEMKHDDHIFKCPYCKTSYLVGISNINSVV